MEYIRSLLVLLFVALAYINHLNIRKGIGQNSENESIKAWHYVLVGNKALLLTLIVWFIISTVTIFI